MGKLGRARAPQREQKDGGMEAGGWSTRGCWWLPDGHTFRRNVVGSSHASGHVVIASLERLRQSKVNDHRLRVGGFRFEEKVLRLEVSVDDVVFVVAVLDGQQSLFDERGGIPLAVVALNGLGLCDDTVEELAPGAQLGDDVQIMLVLENVHDVDDVRVIHRQQDVNLTPEAEGHRPCFMFHISHSHGTGETTVRRDTRRLNM